MAGKISLGISLYPDFYSEAELKTRIDYAKSLGYQRIFTSIQLGDLGFENTQNEITPAFRFLFDYAKKQNMLCHVDINDTMLKTIGATVDDLKSVLDLNIPIVRLDGGFNNAEIARLTNNPYGIIIEDNLSNYNQLDERLALIKKQGNLKQYQACHNFYPRNDTGLDLTEAVLAAKKYQAYGCLTGIFISSLASKNDLNATGFGVPSIERHRYLPSYTQAQEIIATQAFDFLLFGDSDPTSAELTAVAKANQLIKDVLTENHPKYFADYLDFPCIDLPVYLENLSESEMKLVESIIFVDRSDRANQVIRATQSRGKLKLPPSLPIKRYQYGIYIDNNLSNRYTGEIHIMLTDLPPAAYVNYIGLIKPYARHLLALIHQGTVAFRIRREQD